MTPTIATESTAAEVLARRRLQLKQRIDAFTALTIRWNGLGNIRLILFATAAILGGWWLFNDSQLSGFVAIPIFLAFLIVVWLHRSVGRERRRAELLAQLAQETIWRLERNWELLPLRYAQTADPEHPYAADMDLLGTGSLMHLIDRSVTPIGRSTLATWLLAPASIEAIRRRQSAVNELAGTDELRDRIAVDAEVAGAAEADPGPFIEWAESEPVLTGRSLLVLSARIFPPLLVGLVAAQVFGVIPLPLWIVPLAANLLISQLVGGMTAPSIERAGSQRGSLRGYAAVLRVLEDEPFKAEALVRLRREIEVEGKAPSETLGWLNRITRWWMPRSSLAYLPAQAFLAWDLNYLSWLERWQRAAGGSVRSWLNAAGELEALSSFAALRADHPEWVQPTIDPTADRVEAIALGHPLLPDDRCVKNDVTVGPTGTFLLVTGSNMSGKSTLLRSVGATIVLANAGAPVCADSMTLPQLDLWTSVRVHDSLQAGISFFMAELLRLKQITDAANTAPEHGRRLFFILDEMLQGTNTAERQIAARRIIRHLVEHGGLGAVSTHDLTLADGPELGNLAIPVHLTETVRDRGDGDAMVFDYRLRPGIAVTTNALKLMDVVGFDFGDGNAHHLRLERAFSGATTDNPGSSTPRETTD
ncbi:MutS family DNA mismatch repair protein [soil metagenome]